jgi:hypothetical protein
MSTSTLHPAVAEYLRKVRRAGRDLPRERLGELLSDLEEHLSAAIPADASDEQAREALARFGDPREIVDAERPASSAPRERRGTREWAAIFLLLFGVAAAGIGWLVGVVLLWSSRAWTTGDKVIGTLFLPGGLFASAVLLLLAGGRAHKEMCVSRSNTVLHCTQGASSGPSTIVSIALILLALTPVISAVHLARRAR